MVGTLIPLLGATIPLFALFIVFSLPAVIVFIVLRYKANRSRMLQETILKLAEKGHPIPDRLLEGNFGDSPRGLNDNWQKQPPLHKGIIMIAIGAGLIIMLLSMGISAWGSGLIPLLAGVGYLIIWKLEDRNLG